MAISKNLKDKKLNLLYPSIVDGNSKTKKQNVKNIKPTATDDTVFTIGQSLGTLINAPSIEIEQMENYTLEEQ